MHYSKHENEVPEAWTWPKKQNEDEQEDEGDVDGEDR